MPGAHQPAMVVAASRHATASSFIFAFLSDSAAIYFELVFDAARDFAISANIGQVLIC